MVKESYSLVKQVLTMLFNQKKKSALNRSKGLEILRSTAKSNIFTPWWGSCAVSHFVKPVALSSPVRTACQPLRQ